MHSEACPHCGLTDQEASAYGAGGPGNQMALSATDPDLNPVTEFVAEEEFQRALEEYNERS